MFTQRRRRKNGQISCVSVRIRGRLVYQMEQRFVGFIGLPAGHWKTCENSSKLDSDPMTLAVRILSVDWQQVHGNRIKSESANFILNIRKLSSAPESGGQQSYCHHKSCWIRFVSLFTAANLPETTGRVNGGANFGNGCFRTQGAAPDLCEIEEKQLPGSNVESGQGFVKSCFFGRRT